MNYIGSKFSLLDFLQKTITEVTGITQGNGFIFADLFAGTGVVGYTFKSRGFKVLSNDIQYYSYCLNKHYIENDQSNKLELLEYLNNLKGIEGFIFNNFCEGSGCGRNYFTDTNGKKCDAIRLKLEELFRNGEIPSTTYYWYLASLINSIDKYANTASVYGAFLKHIKKSAQKDFLLELLPIITGDSGKVYNQDINTLIKIISGDILYLDPPYNSRQYCSNYHLLETIAKYDNPILKGKTGLRDYENQKSAYCSKKTVAQAFEQLIAAAKFKYIFLSYNNEGLMSINTISNIMKNYGEYKCYTQGYKRFKADNEVNRNIIADTTTEYLHCLIKDF